MMAEPVRGLVPELIDPVQRLVNWLDMGSTPFVEPFYQFTIKRFRSEHPEARQVFTPLEHLVGLERRVDSLSPSGFVLHVSRCGSTLVANALRQLDGVVVLSEPTPLNGVLALRDPARPGRHREMHDALLRGVVAGLGQRRTGEEQRLILKLTHWSTFFLSALRRLWPETPFLFLARDPVDVVVSNLRTGRGKPADIPWVSALTGEPPMNAAASAEEVLARLVGGCCREAAVHAGPHSLFLDYEHLSPETMARIARFFGLDPDPAAERMTAVFGAYSKDPDSQRTHVPDTEGKRREASPRVREAVERWARGAYDQLAPLAEVT